MTFSIFFMGLIVSAIIALLLTMRVSSYEDTKAFRERQRTKNDPVAGSTQKSPTSGSFTPSAHKRIDSQSSSQIFSDSSLFSSSGCYADSYSSDSCSSDSSGCDGGSSGCD